MYVTVKWERWIAFGINDLQKTLTGLLVSVIVTGF